MASSDGPGPRHPPRWSSCREEKPLRSLASLRASLQTSDRTPSVRHQQPTTRARGVGPNGRTHCRSSSYSQGVRSTHHGGHGQGHHGLDPAQDRQLDDQWLGVSSHIDCHRDFVLPPGVITKRLEPLCHLRAVGWLQVQHSQLPKLQRLQ